MVQFAGRKITRDEIEINMRNGSFELSALELSRDAVNEAIAHTNFEFVAGKIACIRGVIPLTVRSESSINYSFFLNLSLLFQGLLTTGIEMTIDGLEIVLRPRITVASTPVCENQSSSIFMLKSYLFTVRHILLARVCRMVKFIDISSIHIRQDVENDISLADRKVRISILPITDSPHFISTGASLRGATFHDKMKYRMKIY